MSVKNTLNTIIKTEHTEKANRTFQENAKNGFWIDRSGKKIQIKDIDGLYAYRIVNFLQQRGLEAPIEIMNIVLKDFEIGKTDIEYLLETKNLTRNKLAGFIKGRLIFEGAVNENTTVTVKENDNHFGMQSILVKEIVDDKIISIHYITDLFGAGNVHRKDHVEDLVKRIIKEYIKERNMLV